ncbi:hypothetical protein F4780DRAFT_728441 [Xylariomycetidae sp. FL0641]|nr:hypothetical protein F4780DRAFT_728441 [Xylariomycetidae sp. FL0641]
MYIAKVLSVALAALVSHAQAECYWTGEFWATGQGSAAMTACTMGLSGNYGPQGTDQGMKYYCIQHSDNLKYEFWVWHIKDGQRDLDSQECYHGLSKEALRCSHGGHRSYKNWSYKADPNTGTCPESSEEAPLTSEAREALPYSSV